MFKRIIAFLIAMSFILCLVSCSRKEETSKITQDNTAETKLSDEEALNEYLRKIHSSEYESEKTLNYDNLSDYMELCDYTKITIPDAKEIRTDVSDDELETYYKYVIMQNFCKEEDYTTLTSGKVQMFDTVKMDYKGYIDGELYENATAEDQTLVIGSGNFIDGFESSLVGKTIGENVTLNLHFSPYYSNKDIADKDVRFEVKIKSVDRAQIPEVTVEELNEYYSTDFKSLDELKNAMKSDLVAQKLSTRYDLISDYTFSQIVKNSNIKKYPEKEIKTYKDEFRKYYNSYAAEYDMSLEDFLLQNVGIDLAEFEKIEKEYAENSVATDMMIKLVAQKENIEITDEDITDFISLSYGDTEYFSDLNSYIEYYSSIHGLYYFVDSALWLEVADKLVETVS